MHAITFKFLKIYLIDTYCFLLFKLFFFIIIIFGNFQICSSQPTYQIPWASTQPKFVFPIYFEEESGMKDTIYFCYDPRASTFQPNQSDSIFGQKLIRVDTSRFYAYIESDHLCSSTTLECDSQYKVSVAPIQTGLNSRFPTNWTRIKFHNGSLPLKIYWDVSTLYSDSLPFNFISGFPKAQGRFGPSSSSLGIEVGENGQSWPASGLPYLLLLTDNGGPALKDSCRAYAINGGGPFDVENFGFSLFFEEWTGVINSLNNLDLIEEIISYNLITKEIFFTTNRTFSSCKIEIIDISGKMLDQVSLQKKDVGYSAYLNLCVGLYFVILDYDGYRISKSFVVIEE